MVYKAKVRTYLSENGFKILKKDEYSNTYERVVEEDYTTLQGNRSSHHGSFVCIYESTSRFPQTKVLEYIMSRREIQEYIISCSRR